MPEQRIVITIDEEGGIEAKTSGFKGEACLEALNTLLELDGTVAQVKKTDEYHQKAERAQKRHIEQKKGRQ